MSFQVKELYIQSLNQHTFVVTKEMMLTSTESYGAPSNVLQFNIKILYIH